MHCSSQLLFPSIPNIHSLIHSFTKYLGGIYYIQVSVRTFEGLDPRSEKDSEGGFTVWDPAFCYSSFSDWMDVVYFYSSWLPESKVKYSAERSHHPEPL